MSDDATARFTGLAEGYARCRPVYPASAIDFVLDACGLAPRMTVVDVGAGTGIAAHLLAARGLRVVAVEPNADMRRRIEPAPGLEVRAGRAESLPLDDESADAVVAAQAVHWFDPEPALAEMARVLRPGGHAVSLGYERDETDPFTRAYGNLVRGVPGAPELERRRASAPEILATSPRFGAVTRASFPTQQDLDQDEFLGRAFTVSYLPRRGQDAAAVALEADLRALFARHAVAGRTVLHYVTAVLVAARI